jgi:gliding motility-associated-like protein
VNLGADTILCKNELVELSVENWNSTYVWNDGSTLSNRRITKPGFHWVIATNICGVAKDSLNIQFRENNCRVYCPNAFTPNADYTNEYFKPIIFDVDVLNYRIFNRWGEQLYEGTEKDLGWDGNYGGAPAPAGSYVIMYDYKYKSGNRVIRGSEQLIFLLLR